MIHPSTIHVVKLTGTSDMGDPDDASKGVRLVHPRSGDGFSIKSLLVRAISGSDGVATLSLKMSDPDNSAYNFTTQFWENFGLGSTARSRVFMRIDNEDLPDFAMYRDEETDQLGEFVLEWANPGSPKQITWSIMARLVAHQDIPNDPSTILRQ